jgi:hypothetical protein
VSEPDSTFLFTKRTSGKYLDVFSPAQDGGFQAPPTGRVVIASRTLHSAGSSRRAVDPCAASIPIAPPGFYRRNRVCGCLHLRLRALYDERAGFPSRRHRVFQWDAPSLLSRGRGGPGSDECDGRDKVSIFSPYKAFLGQNLETSSHTSHPLHVRRFSRGASSPSLSRG